MSTACVSCVLFFDAGSHWMPRFWARLWARAPAMAKLFPYCGEQQHNKQTKTKTHRSHASHDDCMQTKWRWTTSDLIHTYAPAHRTHASEVRSAASTVVEGHISWRLMDDRSGRDRRKGWWKHHRGLDKGKQEPDQTLDFLFCSNCRYARWQRLLV